MQTYLEETGLFDKSEIEYFLSFGKTVILKKGESYIIEGDIAKKFAFVKSGLLRSFYYASNSEEVTYCFSFPNDLIAGYSSLITQEKTRENIQAILDCDLIEFPKRILDDLVSEKRNWLLFAKQIAEKKYLLVEKRIFILQKENAVTAYKDLLNKHSDYLQKIPLGYLASYLGISQRHLSRIRKQISF
jgi:CRP-like cAMP-binding protein